MPSITIDFLCNSLSSSEWYKLCIETKTPILFLFACLLWIETLHFLPVQQKMKRKSFVIEWYGSVQAGNCWTDYSFTFENCCSNEAFAVFLFNTRSSWSTKPQLTVNRKKVILFHLHRAVNSFFYRALLLLLWPYIRHPVYSAHKS